MVNGAIYSKTIQIIGEHCTVPLRLAYEYHTNNVENNKLFLIICSLFHIHGVFN